MQQTTTHVKDALMLMISFGALIVALLTLVVAIIAMINHKK
nr:putative holin-like toxin [Paenibacillus sp. TCA20]